MRHTLVLTLLVACAGTALGQKHAPSLSGCHALTGVTVVTRPGQRVENVTLVVRDGLVQDVGIDVPAPADAEVIDGTGLVVTAGFTVAGPGIGERAPTPDPKQPDDVTSAPSDWQRMGISPQRTVKSLLAGKDPLPGKDWLAEGVTNVIVHPTGRLIPGQASVVSTGDGSPSERLLREDVGLVIGFSRGRGGYPSSLMGTVAALRQTFLDTRRLRSWRRTFATNPNGIQAPPHWPEIEAAIPALDGAVPTLFSCRNEMDVRRAADLAREFGLKPWMRGGSGLGKGAARIADARAVAILDVAVTKPKYKTNQAWLDKGPDPASEPQARTPKDDPERPAAVKATDGGETPTPAPPPPPTDPYVEEMRTLLAKAERETLTPHATAGATLQEADVTTVIGIDKPKGLIDHLRAQIRFGFDGTACLASLTERPAALVGLDGALGRVAPGFRADLVVWRGEPLTDAAIAYVFCRGERYDLPEKKSSSKDSEKEPKADGNGPVGTWTVRVEGRDEASTLKITSTDGTYAGSYDMGRGSATVSSVKVDGKSVEIVSQMSGDGFEVEITMSGTLSSDGKSMSGDLKFGDFGESSFTATKGGGN